MIGIKVLESINFYTNYGWAGKSQFVAQIQFTSHCAN